MPDTPLPPVWMTALDWVVRGGFLLTLAALVKQWQERRKPAAEVEESVAQAEALRAQARRHDTETELAVLDRAFARVESLQSAVEKLEAKIERVCGERDGLKTRCERRRTLLLLFAEMEGTPVDLRDAIRDEVKDAG